MSSAPPAEERGLRASSALETVDEVADGVIVRDD